MCNIRLIFRMLKVSVNGESQRLVVREVTGMMYNTDQLLENMMIDCWVLVFALDNKQSFGKLSSYFKLLWSDINNNSSIQSVTAFALNCC